MLDLDAAVQLEEVEVVAVENELDGAGAAIADRPAEGDGRLVERRAKRRREPGRGRLLEHLLVSPLDGAVALADRDDGSVRVGEQLHLDVSWSLEVALAVERPVAERAGRLALGCSERVLELGRRANDAHPAPAATRGRLDEEREADLLRRSVGQDGTPASRAIRFAASLSPPSRSASGGGPTHVSPAASTAAAKSAFSARNP